MGTINCYVSINYEGLSWGCDPIGCDWIFTLWRWKRWHVHRLSVAWPEVVHATGESLSYVVIPANCFIPGIWTNRSSCWLPVNRIFGQWGQYQVNQGTRLSWNFLLFFSPMWGFQWKPATGEILPPPSQIITAYFPFKFHLSHHCCYLINNYWYWIWSQNVENGISGLLDSKIFWGSMPPDPPW